MMRDSELLFHLPANSFLSIGGGAFVPEPAPEQAPESTANETISKVLARMGASYEVGNCNLRLLIILKRHCHDEGSRTCQGGNVIDRNHLLIRLGVLPSERE